MSGEAASGKQDLFALVALGDLQRLRTALAGGEAADPRDRYGATPLYWAAAGADGAAVAALLDAGADPGAVTDAGNTPLMVAAAMGAGAVVRRLLAAGAEVGHQNRWGLDAMRWAQWSPDAAAMRELLQQKASGDRFA